MHKVRFDGVGLSNALDSRPGLLRLDRVLYSTVYYPPTMDSSRRLAEDDDPLDAGPLPRPWR